VSARSAVPESFTIPDQPNKTARVEPVIPYTDPKSKVPRGTLTPESLGRTIDVNRHEIRACHTAAQAKYGPIRGKLSLEFTVSQDGYASGVRALRNRKLPASLVACIVSRAARWRYPEPKRSSQTLTFPIVLNPEI